jgi:heme/copper-type cytochrome/quinol oxidase subunit 3
MTTTTKIYIEKNILKKWGRHQFHLMDSSPLPILMAFAIFLVVLLIIGIWHFDLSGKLYVSFLKTPEILRPYKIDFIGIVLTFFLSIMLLWFRQIVKESNAGYHTPVVQQGLRLGMVLFITSEIFFFFAFFWAFFHFSSAPSVMIGCAWPPVGFQPIDPWGLPFVNTLLLLSSGITITLAHKALLRATVIEERYIYIYYLTSTIVLGITFLACQIIEYTVGVSFSWKDTVYGSIFFTTTAFHGFHVTFGTLFLWFCLVRDVFYLLITKPYGFLFAYAHSLNRNLPPIKNAAAPWRKYNKVSVSLGTGFQFLNRFDRSRNWLLKSIVFPKYVIAIIFYIFPSNFITNLMRVQEPLGWQDALLYRKMLGFSVIQNTWQKYVSSPTQHVGFESAAWYWHFVDVVWLFLFVTIYCWGN